MSIGSQQQQQIFMLYAWNLCNDKDCHISKDDQPGNYHTFIGIT